MDLKVSNRFEEPIVIARKTGFKSIVAIVTILTEASTIIKAKFVDVPVKTCLLMCDGFMIQAAYGGDTKRLGHHLHRKESLPQRNGIKLNFNLFLDEII